jgi:hypothetical protein
MLQFTFDSETYLSVAPNQNSYMVVFNLPNGKNVMLDPRESAHHNFTAHEVETGINCVTAKARLL